MIFNGKVISVGHNPLYDAPTVVLELSNGHSLEIVVTRQMAIQFGKNLFSVVEVELKNPFVSWPGQAAQEGGQEAM